MRPLHTCAFAAALFALTGCTRNTTQNAPISAAKQEAEAEAQLCKDMTQRQAAIKEFPAVTPETPLEQVKSASQRAEQAVQEVGQATKNVNDPQLLEIQAAFLQLQNTVNAVPGGRTTVGEASTSVQAHADMLRQVWDQVYVKLQCGA